jgi:hypothetical protein
MSSDDRISLGRKTMLERSPHIICQVDVKESQNSRVDLPGPRGGQDVNHPPTAEVTPRSRRIAYYRAVTMTEVAMAAAK